MPDGATPQSHSQKAMPTEKNENSVVEAYGSQKCPKLVSQIEQTTNLTLRNNALKVLCEEVRNPYSAGGVVKSHVIPILNELTVKADDKLTRELASKALSAMAIDSNGRASMIETKTCEMVIKGLDDESPVVRENVYTALLNLSAIHNGVVALVDSSYPKLLCEKSNMEIDDVRHLPLSLLYNCIKVDEGLQQALACSAVEVCIDNLSHATQAVRKASASTLGFLCFADSAKVAAIQNDAVAKLSVLLDDGNWNVRANAAGALMSIIQTDAGKKAIVPAGIVPKLIRLLKDVEPLVKINVLKVISCAAVHPEARKEMRESGDCLPVIKVIIEEGDDLLKRHAEVAKEAVLWQP